MSSGYQFFLFVLTIIALFGFYIGTNERLDADREAIIACIKDQQQCN